jgi:hypothetical protein
MGSPRRAPTIRAPGFTSGSSDAPFTSGSSDAPFTSGSSDAPFTSGSSDARFISGSSDARFRAGADDQPPACALTRESCYVNAPTTRPFVAAGLSTDDQRLAAPHRQHAR